MKNSTRSATVVLAVFVLSAVYACGAGPQGDCSSRPEQGSCVNTSDDGDAHWYFDEDELLVWCHDGSSPNLVITGPPSDGEDDVSVDTENGDVTIPDVGTAECQP